MSTPDAIKTTPASRWSRYRRWGFRVLFLLLLGAAVAYWTVPVLVKRAIESSLRDAGLIDPAVTLNHMGLWEARAAVVTADGLLSLPSVKVTYTPGDLWRGRVKDISVDGAEWHIRLTTGGITWGGLQPLAPGAPRAQWLPIPRLPLDSLTLSATVVVEAGGRHWHVPVSVESSQREGGMVIRASSDSLLGELACSADVIYGKESIAIQGSFVDAAGLSRTDAQLSYETQVTSVRLTVEPHGPRTLRLPWGGASLSNPRLSAGASLTREMEVSSLEATFTAAEIGFGDRVVRDLTLTARAVSPDAAASPLSLGHAELAIAVSGKHGRRTSSSDAPEAATSFEAGGSLVLIRDARGNALRFVSDTYDFGTFELGGVTIALPHVKFSGTARVAPLDPVAPYTFVGSVELENASVEHEASGFRLSDITAHIPVAWGAANAERGTIRVGQVELAGLAMEGLSGEVHVDESGAAAVLEGTLAGLRGDEAKSSLADLPRIRGEFVLRLEDVSPVIEAKLVLPEWKTQNPFLLAHHVPQLEGWEIIGRIAADAQLTYSHGRVDSSASISVSDATFSHPAVELELSGVALNLKAGSLTPPSTPGAQRVTVRRFKYGKMEATDLLLEFRVEALDSLFVERAQWSMGAKGNFNAYAFRLDPRNPRIEAELYGRDMQLQEWLRLFGGERVAAQGVMSGRVPFVIDPQSQGRMLRLGRGFIHAAPGNGSIVVGERKLVEDVVSQSNVALPTVQGVDMNKALIDALTDFIYGSLAFELVPGDDGVTLVVNIAGRGRQSNPPINFQGITINVSRFDELINHAWREHAGTMESIDRGLDRLSKPTPLKENRP